VLTRQGAIAALVRELAMQAELVQRSGVGGRTVWRLRVERESLRATALRDKLQAVLQPVLGEPVDLELVAGQAQDSPALREAATRAQAQQQAELTITADPVVRDLMTQFKTARIVPGSIKPVSRNP
jgi:DNA polymerase-3 subunit gamma/tau